MNDDDRALLFEAGRLANHLSWPNPDVISASQIAALSPVGGGVIVLCGQGGMTTDQARTVAAISGAGRPVRVITATLLPPDVVAWLPAESIHESGTAFPSSGTPEPADSDSKASQEGRDGAEGAVHVASTPGIRQTGQSRAALVERIVRHFADDPNPKVRATVAAYDGTPSAVLRQLSRDPERGIRVRVACNPNTPPETLAALAREDYEIQVGVAMNPQTPTSLGVTLDPSAWHIALPPPQSLRGGPRRTSRPGGPVRKRCPPRSSRSRAGSGRTRCRAWRRCGPG